MDNNSNVDQKRKEQEKYDKKAMMGRIESECGKLERTLWKARWMWAW
jgi:hypothetical protein